MQVPHAFVLQIQQMFISLKSAHLNPILVKKKKKPFLLNVD